MSGSNPFLSSFRSSLATVQKSCEGIFIPHLSTGNGKLKKEKIASFGLVAGITCPGADKCNSNRFCYAQNSRYLMKEAMNARVENFLSSKQEHFVTSMITLLRSLPSGWNTIRIHDSGDFYSNNYIQKWAEIIQTTKNKFFYAYTKSLNLKLSEIFNLQNALIIQSEGGKFDHLINYEKPHAKIFLSVESMSQAGYVDATTSDIKAIESHKIGLLVHGGGKSRFD